MSIVPQLISDNLGFLNQGMELTRQLTDFMYQNNQCMPGINGVGKHLRHIVDHYNCFLNGMQDKIDYDQRQRDNRMETNRSLMLKNMKRLMERMQQVQSELPPQGRPVQVKSNQTADGAELWCASTIERELQYLISHTVHHYAIISLILRIQGFETHADFGVAPSTLAYLKSLN